MVILSWLVAGSILLSVAYLAAVSCIGIVAALRAGGRRADAADPNDAVASSHLTMPVSVVIAAGTSPHVNRAIQQALALTYPEFEVIVVVDATDGNRVNELADGWDLEPREFFYRRTLDTAPVRRILRSRHDSRLLIVEKEAAGHTDAVNCGVNLARYRYVAVVPPDVVFAPTALLRAMGPVLRDPVSVVGAASDVEQVSDSGDLAPHVSRVQQLRSIRALMASRLFLSVLPRSIGPARGVVVWRRDAVLQADGFSSTAADPDLDMMFRVQQENGRDERRFVRTGETFGHACATRSRDDRASAQTRQRAALESLQAGISRTTRTRGFAYFLDSEVVTPLLQCWVVVAAAVGAAIGWFTWTAVIASVLLLAFGTAAVSAAALLVRGSQPDAPDAATVRALLLFAPLEALYRPGRVWSRLKGLVAPA